MTHLEDVTVAELQDALGAVEDSRPTQRLLVGIAYKRGVTQSELAEWLGVERKTIYNWLVRLEERPLPGAARDAARSGRRRKLADQDRVAVAKALRDSPREHGYDARTWSPALVRRFLREEYDVAYSRSSCRRLLNDAGLAYRRPRPVAEIDDPRRRSLEAALEGREKRWLPGEQFGFRQSADGNGRISPSN